MPFEVHFLGTRRLRRGLLAGAAAGFLLPAPVSAQILTGDGSITCGTSHVIASGETLSRIADSAYGNSQLYRAIIEANRAVLPANPDNIAVGTSLVIPCLDASGKILTAEEAATASASIQAAIAAEGPLDPAELDALFGPVALFPDQVLTPLLVAVTFPLDVVKAGRFVEESSALSDKDRAAQAATQPWDSSVRELAAGFPDLVTRMSDNIDWTEQAGEATVAQTDAVLEAIQRLRAKAQENGYLVDNQAQKVEKEGDKIVIASSTPGVVYVPTYDSQVVYTTPVAGPPVYHYDQDYDDDDWGDALIAGGIFLGSAIVLDEIFDDDDWHGWDHDDDIDWDRGDITINRDDIDIDRGDINIGDTDRTRIGGGDRVSIGNSDRTQIDRERIANRAGQAGAGDRPRVDGLAANHKPISNDASREAARQKIETRKASGAKPANLQPHRATAQRPAAARTHAAPQQRRETHAAAVSRPAAQRAPKVHNPSRSSAFSASSGHRAGAASGRGHGSMGGRGGRR